MYGVGFGYGSAGATTILKSGGAFDADALSFFTASGITDATQKNAVNQLVLDLKSNSLWTKMKALYPVVGGNATAHSYNLKNTAQYQLTFSSGWTHSSTGMLPNGTSAYADTGFIVPTTSSGLTPQNNHIALYSRTNNQSGYDLFGIANSGYGMGLISRFTNGNAYYIVDATFSPNITNSNGSGLFIGSANSSSTTKLFRNGSLLVSGSTSVTTYSGSTGNILIGTGNSTYSSKESCTISFGLGLSDSEVSTLGTIVNTFNTTLGRNTY